MRRIVKTAKRVVEGSLALAVLCLTVLVWLVLAVSEQTKP